MKRGFSRSVRTGTAKPPWAGDPSESWLTEHTRQGVNPPHDAYVSPNARP